MYRMLVSIQIFLEMCVFLDYFQGDKFRWPDSAVPAVVALEKAAHETLSCDFQKYNQKMRQLTFNLKVSTFFLLRRWGYESVSLFFFPSNFLCEYISTF